MVAQKRKVDQSRSEKKVTMIEDDESVNEPMNNTIDDMEIVKVAFQGISQSYSHLAGKKFFEFAKKVELLGAGTLNSVFQQLQMGNVSYAVIPIESSTYGTIHGVYDRLLESQGKLTIVAELAVVEVHCLCVNNKTDNTETVPNISKVYSHPHILECCSNFLETLESRSSGNVERIPSKDSSTACQIVKNSGSFGAAAVICSREAANFYNLLPVKVGIGNDKNAEVV